MKYKVNISPEAINDINGIYEYISQVLCEENIAVGMVKLLQKSILSLDELPNRFKYFNNEPWKNRGVHIMPVKKYLVFYVIDDDRKTVDVIRVIYGSRELDKNL